MRGPLTRATREETHAMNFIRPFTTGAAALGLGAGLVFAAPFALDQSQALAAPTAFTSKGVATSYQQGQKTAVPNTLYYDRGRIRLEMSQPVSADGSAAFSIVLAREGGDTITMLNPKEKQAMKLEAKSLEAVSDNPSLQKISQFKLSEFGKTFRAKGKSIGKEPIAGHPCTILEQKGKDGHFKLWLSDKHDVPLKFVYFEGGKPAFDYHVSQLTLSANLPDSAYVVPKGYEVTDLAQMLNGAEINIRNK